MTRFSIKIDVNQVEGLAERLGSISASELGLRASEVVNDVTTRFDQSARAGEIADINLSAAYVKGKTDVVLSSASLAPRAEITTRGDLTILGNYSPMIQLRSASTREASAGPRRGRPRGVAVQIRRTRTEYQPKWFTMRLRSGKFAGTKEGVFVRESSRGGKPKHIYGPSPYSLFRYQVRTREDDLMDDLSTTALRRIGDVIEREIGK